MILIPSISLDIVEARPNFAPIGGNINITIIGNHSNQSINQYSPDPYSVVDLYTVLYYTKYIGAPLYLNGTYKNSLKCGFGTTRVNAVVVDDNTVTCLSPNLGVAAQTVSLSLTINNGVSDFTSNRIDFSFVGMTKYLLLLLLPLPITNTSSPLAYKQKVVHPLHPAVNVLDSLNWEVLSVPAVGVSQRIPVESPPPAQEATGPKPPVQRSSLSPLLPPI